jgi:sec-independent protein translocase protein TatB
MEVFGIGPMEIALVVLIAFIVLGPERIPEVMRQLGKWTRQLREMVNNITRDYNADIREITGEITALQEEIRSIQRDLGSIATDLITPPRPPASTPPARSNTTPPADPLGIDRSVSSEVSVQPESSDLTQAGAPGGARPAAPTATESDGGES